MRTKPALRTELLFYLSFFAAAALLVGVATTAVAGPIASGAEFWLVMALVALEVGVFVVFGRYLVTRLVLRPLQHLMSAADQVADGDLKARAPDGETRDFATLAARLNRMTDHLLDAQSQLVRSEKLASVGRLAAGIAHEVGNPLGAVGTFLEVLRRRGAARRRPPPDVVPGRAGRAPGGRRVRGRGAGRPCVRGRRRAGRAAGGSREDLRAVLHDQGARPRDRSGPRHRGARGPRDGWRSVGRPGPGRGGGLQAVLPGGDPMSRVLIVDDEPGLRQSLGLLLADAGYEVAAESDGKRGLERALAERFDLILSDVRMPEMDGLAFLRAYRARGGEALVIMMSAYGGEEAALAAMKEGAYDYIPKPFRPDEVVLTLRKAEEREQIGSTIATLKAKIDSTPAARALVAERRPMRDALGPVP